ncbi:sulfur carrier protein ThiS [Hyphomicrobium sp.]|uniref:sulfur carrier protein ThiS n=1 Tax=Hyphomicrobium sp. TaxID=82 RepID=UPI000FC076C4|nr:sulfur carrier protein ThiS [Hyphomicrobium sp.]RUP08848.1 MAG: sulfur carrier protein ThiS [Hyphomicrobium sp.]
MMVTINGSQARTDATTLFELIEERGYAAMFVATALNGKFITIGERENERLRAGDAVEILTPRQGG